MNNCVRSDTNRNLAKNVKNKSEFSYERNFSKQDHYSKSLMCNAICTVGYILITKHVEFEIAFLER